MTNHQLKECCEKCEVPAGQVAPLAICKDKSCPCHSHQLKEIVREIKYHIISWIEDEGEYQPSEEEATEKVKELIQNLLQRKSEATCNKCGNLVELSYGNGSKSHNSV